ncbi:MAG: hypothetical protein EOM06_07775 [Sphingobacteriia bacterium]|nr:hypothetical protein [Sphingobacteriia bacterium]
MEPHPGAERKRCACCGTL